MIVLITAKTTAIKKEFLRPICLYNLFKIEEAKIEAVYMQIGITAKDTGV